MAQADIDWCFNFRWRSYFTSGSSAAYLFLYSLFYFYTKLDITKWVPMVMYFGYMTIVSISFFCLTGRGFAVPACLAAVNAWLLMLSLAFLMRTALVIKGDMKLIIDVCLSPVLKVRPIWLCCNVVIVACSSSVLADITLCASQAQLASTPASSLCGKSTLPSK